jgi:hypothetical protein
LVLLVSWIEPSLGQVVPLIQPGFFFDYNNATAPGPPAPVTAQCEKITLRWSRGAAIGSNPVAPFVLQIYTSSDETPFIVPAGSGPTFDFVVPFAEGTQYQICMFDALGTPGGCQATYTVIKSTTAIDPTTCQELTPPAPLAVEAKVALGNGAFSRFGFIPYCTDLSVQPKAGKPPFTMTIAPALHPPYNITSNSMDPISWAVSLSWSFQFYISVVSSDGLMWANGPLHVGGFGPNENCLAPGTMPMLKAQAIAAGASVGSLFGGLLIGALLLLTWSWKKGQGFNPFKWQKHPFHEFDAKSVGEVEANRQFQELQVDIDRLGQWDRLGVPGAPASSYGGGMSVAASTPTQPTPPTEPLPRAFVIHHDGGRAPVTVVAAEPTEFVEMPPEYNPRGVRIRQVPAQVPVQVPPPRSTSHVAIPPRNTSLRTNTVNTSIAANDDRSARGSIGSRASSVLESPMSYLSEKDPNMSETGSF